MILYMEGENQFFTMDFFEAMRMDCEIGVLGIDLRKRLNTQALIKCR